MARQAFFLEERPNAAHKEQFGIFGTRDRRGAESEDKKESQGRLIKMSLPVGFCDYAHPSPPRPVLRGEGDGGEGETRQIL